MERTFRFDFPPEKFPDLLERVRGTPARVEELVRGLSRDALTRSDGAGWSIQQNIGHLIDLGYLPMRRIDQILAGEKVLIAADMANRATREADHNGREIGELLAEFRRDRGALVAKFESVDAADWGKSGIHPRLNQPFRIVDIAYFDSEHDDYHIARISELKRIR
jgi:hypothetical protein